MERKAMNNYQIKDIEEGWGDSINSDMIFYSTMSDNNRISLLSNWKSAIRKLQYT